VNAVRSATALLAVIVCAVGMTVVVAGSAITAPVPQADLKGNGNLADPLPDDPAAKAHCGSYLTVSPLGGLFPALVRVGKCAPGEGTSRSVLAGLSAPVRCS
jgi:hypothetical protein